MFLGLLRMLCSCVQYISTYDDLQPTLNIQADRNKRNEQRSSGQWIEWHGALFFAKNNGGGQERALLRLLNSSSSRRER